MKKLKDLFLPYTIREKIFFSLILWFVFILTLVLGKVWHPLFLLFSAITAVLIILYSWAAFRCKYCDRYVNVDINTHYCPHCGKPL